MLRLPLRAAVGQHDRVPRASTTLCSLRWALLGLTAAAGIEAWLVVRRAPGYAAVGDDVRWLVVEQAAGWALLVAAVLSPADSERPGRRIGLLSVAAAWFVAVWNSPGATSSAVFTAGLVLGAACPVVLAHVALGWTARDRQAASRLLLAFGYLAAVGLTGVLPAMLSDPATAGCNGCPANLLLVTDAPQAAALAERLGTWAGALWAPVLAVVVSWRFVRWASPRRRAAVGVVPPAVGLLLVVAVEYWLAVGRGYLGSAALDRRLHLVEAVLLVVVAVGTGWPALDRRLTRARVARLVVVAGELSAPGGVDRSLGQAVGDPSLRVLYSVGDRCVDAAGRPVVSAPGRVTTSITHRGEVIAVLEHRPGSLDRDGLAEDVASTAGLVLENSRLQAERSARLADLQASRTRVVAAADEERRRLERDLHDGAQQVLVASALSLQLARLRAAERDPGAARKFQAAQKEVTAALAALRLLARGLCPRELADEGLAAALDVYAESATIPVTVLSVPQERFPAPVESTAFFVVAHQLGRPGLGHASVRVDVGGDVLLVEIEDDGPAADLESITDRVAALAGTVSAEPVPAGTRIRAELPCVS